MSEPTFEARRKLIDEGLAEYEQMLADYRAWVAAWRARNGLPALPVHAPEPVADEVPF